MAMNNTGWLCPRCQRVNAPWRDECRCNDERPGGALAVVPGVSPFRWSPGTGTWPRQWETTTATQTSPSDWTIINGTFTMLASEAVLRREWDTPEEDEAWENLGDTPITNGAPAVRPGYQLLPCPFCGGQVRFGQNDGDYASQHTWWIECESCGVEMNGSADKGETFAMWNRRAPTPGSDPC